MNFNHQTWAHDQAQLLKTSNAKYHSKQVFYGWWVVLVGDQALLRRPPSRLIRQRVLQTINAGVPRWSRSCVSREHPQAARLRQGLQLCIRRVCTAARSLYLEKGQ